ncbi:MAG: UDP-N-acetylmuramoyl-L-alanyl-D-glutamate--2,6-diaminopimelate ligase [Burkholderiaceae bacterium]
MAPQLLPSVDAALGWLAQRGAGALGSDSRRVQRGDAFIAWPGHGVDGRSFVGAALEAGAVAALVEAQGAEAFGFASDPRVAAIAGLKAATGEIASRFMGQPSARLHVVACTGTNGKTSMAWWVAQGLSMLGSRCGLVGTLGIGEPPRGRAFDGPPSRDRTDESRSARAPVVERASPDDRAVPGREPSARPAAGLEPTGLTTPDPISLQAALRRFADTGFRACAIEASSIGLVEYRLAGTHIEVALFSNFTQDHLDFHGSMAAYWAAKAQLFAWPGLRAAVVNIDDAQGRTLAAGLGDTTLELWTYSTHSAARLRASGIGYADGGLLFQVHEADGAAATVATGLIGTYNVSNLLAVVGALRCLGVPLADAARACAALTPVPGRMQRVAVGATEDGARRADGVASGTGSFEPDRQPEVVVDYAHTPDALEKALLALQPFAAERGGSLWCVFGCGGNRDAGKRPLMGALAQALAQHVVVTNDNPRSEAPAFILLQIVAGLVGGQQRVKVIEDRRAAIAHAVRHADARDVILIAGKGHEDYQEIGGVKHPFSDVDEARAALLRREGGSR